MIHWDGFLFIGFVLALFFAYTAASSAGFALQIRPNLKRLATNLGTIAGVLSWAFFMFGCWDGFEKLKRALEQFCKQEWACLLALWCVSAVPAVLTVFVLNRVLAERVES